MHSSTKLSIAAAAAALIVMSAAKSTDVMSPARIDASNETEAYSE
jgi:hypothetical protein